MTKQSVVLLAFVQAALLVAMLLGWIRLAEAKAASQDASRNADLCRRLVDEIRELRETPVIVEDHGPGGGLTNQSLMSAFRQVGIEDRQVGAIRRSDPRAIPETDYERHDVGLSVRAVTLESLLRYAMICERQFSGCRVSSLSISAAASPARRQSSVAQPGAERWNAELALTNLVYVARKAR